MLDSMRKFIRLERFHGSFMILPERGITKVFGRNIISENGEEDVMSLMIRYVR